jgi:hypothetical protein
MFVQKGQPRSREVERSRKQQAQEHSILEESRAFLFLRLIEGMIMCWRALAVAGLAVLAVCTWTAARAGDPEQRGPNSNVRLLTLDADSTADTVLVAQRGGFAPHHSSPGFYHSSPSFRHPSPGFAFGRSPHFDNRFNFRRFDRVEDRLEAQLRRTNPALFRRFDRIEDRLEAQLRRTNPFLFRRFDRIEDRLEAQLRRGNPFLFQRFDRFEDRLEADLRRANPFLFRRFDRIEDRLEDRLRTTPAQSSRFAFRAFGDPRPAVRAPAIMPQATRVTAPPAAPRKQVYLAYGE